MKYLEKKLFLNFYGDMHGKDHSYQVYSLLLGTLLMKNVIKDVFLRPT